jgi:hypothetical protein
MAIHVDWSKAPKGTTHAYVGSGCREWHWKDGAPTEHNEYYWQMRNELGEHYWCVRAGEEPHWRYTGAGEFDFMGGVISKPENIANQ